MSTKIALKLPWEQAQGAMGAQSGDLGPAVEKNMHDWVALFSIWENLLSILKMMLMMVANTYMTFIMC